MAKLAHKGITARLPERPRQKQDNLEAEEPLVCPSLENGFQECSFAQRALTGQAGANQMLRGQVTRLRIDTESQNQLFPIKRAYVEDWLTHGPSLPTLPRSGGRGPCPLPVTAPGPRPKHRSSGGTRALRRPRGRPCAQTAREIVTCTSIFQRRPAGSCCFTSLGQGDPGRLINNSANRWYLDGNVIFHC